MIADCHRVVVEGIKSALANHQDLEVRAEASSGRQALQLAKTVSPQIIIMDVPMPDFKGISTVLKLRALLPEARIIIFSTSERRGYLPSLIAAGIVGYVQKDADLSELVLAVHAAKNGETHLPVMNESVWGRGAKHLAADGSVSSRFRGLGLREREVFQRLANGQSIAEIARKMGTSPKTVESQKYKIMQKLEAKTLSDLIRIAVRRQVIRI